jgi:ribosomal protein S18 acetylase RimI-like enzyme
MTSIRVAKRAAHKEIMSVASQHRATKDFGNRNYSSVEIYQKEWIVVATIAKKIVGFYAVRHKVRVPETSLYFIGVRQDTRRDGVGTLLLEDLMERCPNPRIVLGCLKDNIEALAFYQKHGFRREGEALSGHGWQLVKEW